MTNGEVIQGAALSFGGFLAGVGAVFLYLRVRGYEVVKRH